MANPIMEVDTKHLKFKHPYNTLLVGMTGSGKTQLMLRILKNYKYMFHKLNKEKIKVLWYYGQQHSLIDLQLDDSIEILYIEGLPDKIEECDIVIIDDLLDEIHKSKTFESLFIKKSHHLGISVFFLVQNLFYNAKSMVTVTRNCHYIILMKNPRDKTQVMNLAKQVYPGNTKFMMEAYNNATERAFGYIRLDFSPDTPEYLRIQTRITPEENFNLYSPIVYLPKNVEKSK